MSSKIKMELWLTPEDKDDLFDYSKNIRCYDEFKRGKHGMRNASLTVRIIIDLLLFGSIRLPENELNQKINLRRSKRYRPIVDKTQRDKFLKFCKDEGYSPNQAIMWVVKNEDINKYL